MDNCRETRIMNKKEYHCYANNIRYMSDEVRASFYDAERDRFIIGAEWKHEEKND